MSRIYETYKTLSKNFILDPFMPKFKKKTSIETQCIIYIFFRYRIFDINPEKWEEDMIPSLVIKETEMIYDHCWAGGGMFLSTGRYQPVHLWSGNTGQLQASYKCFNHLGKTQRYQLGF